MREISAYIAEVLRIREELKETIFLGDFLDLLEVSVAPRPNCKSSDPSRQWRAGVHRSHCRFQESGSS
jgi:hypothetical protein